MTSVEPGNRQNTQPRPRRIAAWLHDLLDYLTRCGIGGWRRSGESSDA